LVGLDELFSKPRKSARSYGELLPWFGMIDDAVVLCHDGSIIAGFAYEGSDIEGVLDDDINRRIDLLQTAMRQLTDRITVWSIQRRRFSTSYPQSVFTNPVAGIIDAQWGAKCTEYPNAELTHRIYLGYSFPNKTEALFEQLRSEMEQTDNALKAIGSVLRRRFTEKSAIANVRGQLTEMRDDFENILSSFSNIVTSSLGFTRLRGADLLGDLYSQANLASPPGPVAVPTRPVYLSTMLPADDLIRHGGTIELRGPSQSVYCAALSTTGMPPEACSVHLDSLMASHCEYVLVQTFKFIDKFAAEKNIQAAEQFYRTEVKSASVRMFENITGMQSEKINTGNLALADDAQEALVSLTAGELSYGWYNMTVLALGVTPREVDRATDVIASTLRAGGYTITRERQGLMSAFLGSMPGNQTVQIRKYLASSSNLADLAPIRTISRGEPEHRLFSRILRRTVPAHIRFMTPYGVPYDFNLHAQDLGHTVVIGGSGSGKSTVMSLLIAQFQKFFPCQTFIFDKDHSMALMSTLLGGANIEMANPGTTGPRINPVRRMLTDGDDKALLRWIDVIFGTSEGRMTAEDKETVNAAIQKMRSLRPENWRLGTLYALLNGNDRRIAMRLAPYVDRSEIEGSYAKGAYADFFDNDEDSFTLGTIVCMETGRLLQTPEIAAPFMDYAFYCIEKKLDGQTPTLIYVEESWYMLANPTFEEKINDWLRTFRKKRAFVIFATQSPQELANLKSWAAFVSNVPTRIFLPAINDSISATAGLYRDLFGLNDAQLNLLSNAVPKRDYLLLKPGMTRLVEASMPKLVIAINEATTRRDARDQAIEASRSGDPGWHLKYMREVLNVQI
jgi:type IV secretion/conjugal transfer VirB4 family ATPase